MLTNFWTILFSSLYSFACIGQGFLILSLIKKKHNIKISSPILLTASFILGSSILASIWMFLSLAGIFKISIILFILFPSTIFGLYSTKFYITGIISAIKKIWNETLADTWGWQWIAGISTLLLILGTFSMTQWTGDAIAFYMAVPKLIANTNSLFPLRGYEDFMSVGLLGEMHNAVFLKFNLPISIKLFSGFHSIAGLVILLAISSYTGLKNRGKWLVVTGYVTSSAIYQALGNGKVDLISSAVGICLYYFALTDGPLILIGLLCGFAATLKISYLVTVFPGIAFLIIINVINKIEPGRPTTDRFIRLIKNIVHRGLIIGFWCLVALSSHVIKNGLLLGAPLAPFSGPTNIGWLDQNFFNPETTRRILLTYPFATTFGNYWGQSGNISSLLLALFPFIIFLPKPKKWLNSSLFLITITGLIGMFFWLIRFPSVLAPRYYLPTLLLFFPIGFRGAEYLSKSQMHFQWPKFFIYLCTLLSLFSIGITSIYFFKPDLLIKQLLGKIQTCELDITGYERICTSETKINKIAEEGARIYLTTYYRFWLRTDLLQCTNGKEDMDKSIISNGGQAIWAQLYKRNFTYLMEDGTMSILDPIINHPPDWISLNPVITKNSITVYKINYKNAPADLKPEVACIKNNQGLWDIQKIAK